MSGRDPGGPTAKDAPTQAEKRARNKKRYEMVLETVRRNSSPKQLPGARKTTVVRTLAGYGRFEVGGVEDSIQAAREQHELFPWRDAEGHLRYTVVEGDPLRRLNIYVAQNDLGDDLQARVKAAIQEAIGQ